MLRIALIAITSTSLAACGSPSGTSGDPGAVASSPGVSQPSTGSGGLSILSPSTTEMPMPGDPSSRGTPGAVQPESTCGIYLKKPSRDEWLAEVRADASTDWDRLPDSSKPMITRQDFVDEIVSPLTDASVGPSTVDMFDAAPADKIADYGGIYCEAEKITYPQTEMLPAVRAKPAENLIFGLNYCAELATVVRPADNQRRLKLQQGIHDTLCPQVPGMPYMGMPPGG
jgi:hypothetical protein